MQQKLTHGGDWAGFEAEYGRPPLDFSANVSPLGVPWAVRRVVEGRPDRRHAIQTRSAADSPRRWPGMRA